MVQTVPDERVNRFISDRIRLNAAFVKHFRVPGKFPIGKTAMLNIAKGVPIRRIALCQMRSPHPVLQWAEMKISVGENSPSGIRRPILEERESSMIWFGIDPGEHPFALFSLSHRIVLLISILGSVLIFAARHLLRAFSNRLIETAIALSLVFSEGAYHYWMYKNGIWRFSDSLPLELCSISLFGTIALLFFQKRWIDDLVFLRPFWVPLRRLSRPCWILIFPISVFFIFSIPIS